MNILFISHEKDVNGSSRSLLNIIDLLKEKHKFYVVVRYSNGAFIDELKKRNVIFFVHKYQCWMRKKTKTRLKWLLIKIKWLFFDQYKIWYEAYRIKKEIEKLNIDVIHSNVSVVCIGAYLSRITGIKHIWHIREFGEEDFGFVPIVNYNTFIDYFRKYSSKIITISNAIYKKYNGYFDPSQICAIYNGVDEENILYREYDRNSKTINFLIAGAILEGKGQDVAVRAAKKLYEDGYYSFKLFIAGAGNTQSLRSFFPEQDNYVVFLGKVDNMLLLRKDMDVALMCSVSEGFGLVTVEAMMAGMPVIATNSGANPELVKEGMGFLVPIGDDVEVAKKMEYFIDNPEQICIMGKKAQEYALNNFSTSKSVSEIDNVYCEVHSLK